jgi:hypothetical protein
MLLPLVVERDLGMGPDFRRGGARGGARGGSGAGVERLVGSERPLPHRTLPAKAGTQLEMLLLVGGRDLGMAPTCVGEVLTVSEGRT